MAFLCGLSKNRFGKNWVLSPDQSIAIHSGNWTVPRQLLVRSPKANNNIINLPFDTSLFDIRTTLPVDNDIEQVDGVRIYTLASALVLTSQTFFSQSPMDARAALSILRDSSEILRRLLDGGHSTVAGRLIGAFRNIGRDRIADDILKTMQKAGYDVRENDPFATKFPSVLNSREVSPYANRIKLMWQHMRGTVIENFPPPPGLPVDSISYMKRVEDVFITDAYHSLSIEGYRVTPQLIERDVDAVVSLEGSEVHHYGYSTSEDQDFEQTVNTQSFRKSALSVPYLRLESNPQPMIPKKDSTYNFFSKVNATKQLIRIDSAGHQDFSSLATVVRSSGNCSVPEAYNTISTLTILHFTKYLKGSTNATK